MIHSFAIVPAAAARARHWPGGEPGLCVKEERLWHKQCPFPGLASGQPTPQDHPSLSPTARSPLGET